MALLHDGDVAVWLVHVVGEADLGISSRQRQQEHTDLDEARRVRDARLQAVTTAVKRRDLPALARMLVEDRWADNGHPGEASPPLPGVLRAVAKHLAGADAGSQAIALLLVGTAQQRPGRLDTATVSAAFAEALVQEPALLGTPVARVASCVATQFGESGVRSALAGELSGRARGDRAAVTWGSGSSTLAMGAMTAVIEARLPLALIDLPDDGSPPQAVDPLAAPSTDPVVAMLVRWRLFPTLARLAADPSVPVQLDARQAAVVERLAARWAAGYRAEGVEALRGLVADAVVRGDGTAGFAARRYIEARYDELRAAETGAVNLLRWAADLTPGEIVTLGPRLDRIRRRGHELPGECDRPSARWLLGATVPRLNELGRLSSHTLTPVSRATAERLAGELSPGGRPVDADDLLDVGLPAAPTTAGTTVFVTWLVGLQPAPGRIPLGERFLGEGAGGAVRRYLGIAEDQRKVLDVEALLIATADTAAQAEREKVELHRALRAEVIDTVHGDVVQAPASLGSGELAAHLHAVLAERVPADASAIVVIPSGLKSVALPLTIAARLLGAERGLPVFLREMSDAPPGGETGMHLWPALAGGDLPLLLAAREAAETFELDVAARLLAASSVGEVLGGRCRQLADVMACRLPTGPAGWPEPFRRLPDARAWTCGLLSERLRLVDAQLAAHEQESAPDQAIRIRHLMLAAAAVEVSVGGLVEAGALPDRAQQQFRKHLRELAAAPTPLAEAATVLLLVNEVRDALPITHGKTADVDSTVRHAKERVAGVHDVPTLIRAAIGAAEQMFGPSPVGEGRLVGLYDEWLTAVSWEIVNRQALRRD